MIGHLMRPELEELIREKQWDVLRDALSHFHPSDIAEILVDIPEEDDAPIFRILPGGLQSHRSPRISSPWHGFQLM